MVIAAAAIFAPALALHDDPGTPFELDGDATNAPGTFLGNDGDHKDDWQNVFQLPADGSVGTPQEGSGESFIRDMPPNGGTELQYDAGKDSLDISAWTTKSVGSVVPDKDNIVNAFAKQYMVDLDGNGPQTSHRVIYFGADRFANNGDAALGFWFFQKRVTPSGTHFTPNHTQRNDATGQRGDVLVQVDFVSGGTSSEIQVFEWLGNAAPPPGTPANKLFGGGTLLEIGKGSANGAVVCMPDDATTPLINEADAACATTNETTPLYHWMYAAKFPVKVGKTIQQKYPTESFFEGGIDITQLLGDVCFNSFLANTRTSHSETADLKDLALDDFNTCGSITGNKVCYADEEFETPAYNDANQTFTTTHRVVVENDGQGGNVFDLQIRDDAVGGTNTCAIVGVTKGGVDVSGSYPIALPVANPATPAEEEWVDIPGGDALAQAINHSPQLVVTVMCVSKINPFENTASVRAAQNSGGVRTLTFTDAEDEEGELADCTKTLNPALTLTKSCPTDVVWEKINNVYTPKVCVTIGIQNTGDVTLNMDQFTDDVANGTDEDLLSNLTLSGTQRILEVGKTISGIVDCYNPTAPDPGSGETDPNLTTYSDTVKAFGYAITDPQKLTKIENTASTTCSLCPVPPAE
jgi:hypothetical protein